MKTFALILLGLAALLLLAGLFFRFLHLVGGMDMLLLGILMALIGGVFLVIVYFRRRRP